MLNRLGAPDGGHPAPSTAPPPFSRLTAPDAPSPVPPVPARGGADRALLVLALATAVPALAALLGRSSAPGLVPPAAAAVLLAVFWLTGPGAVLAAAVRLPLATKLALVPLTGLCLLVATSVTGAWTGVWVPRTATAAVVVATLALATAGLPRTRRAPGSVRPARTGPPRPSGAAVGSVLLSTTALALWAASLPGVREASPSVGGLLAVAPWTLHASVLVVVAAVLLALRHGSTTGAVVAVGALVVVLRATAAASTAVPIYAWTYKHLGVVATLLQERQTLGGGDIYQNWPAMFTAAAWFTETSGAAPIDVAQWTTPVVHAVLCVQVAALARALGARTPGCLAAAALVVPLNWVGQDYYAPQALGIVLATGVLVLLVQSPRSRTAAWASLAVFACLVPTHQLTPFWLVGTAVVLAVLRRAPWWLAVVMAAVLLGYLVPRLDAVSGHGLFSGWNIFANAAGNVPDSDAVGRRLAAAAARTSAVVVWASAAAVLVARYRVLPGRSWRQALSSRSVAVPAVLCFSPFALLGGQSYGGEAILRVALYSAPGCAALLGPVLARALAGAGRRPVAGAAWALTVVVVTTQAYFGAWFLNLVQPEDVAAATALGSGVEPPALILPVLPVGPDRVTARHLDHYAADPAYDVALSTSGYADVAYDRPEDLQRLRQELTARGPRPIYITFTAAMRHYDAFYAVFPPGGYENLRRGLATSPDWTLVRQEGDLWVFQYTAPGWPTS